MDSDVGVDIVRFDEGSSNAAALRWFVSSVGAGVTASEPQLDRFGDGKTFGFRGSRGDGATLITLHELRADGADIAREPEASS